MALARGLYCADILLPQYGMMYTVRAVRRLNSWSRLSEHCPNRNSPLCIVILLQSVTEIPVFASLVDNYKSCDLV